MAKFLEYDALTDRATDIPTIAPVWSPIQHHTEVPLVWFCGSTPVSANLSVWQDALQQALDDLDLGYVQFKLENLTVEEEPRPQWPQKPRYIKPDLKAKATHLRCHPDHAEVLLEALTQRIYPAWPPH